MSQKVLGSREIKSKKVEKSHKDTGTRNFSADPVLIHGPDVVEASHGALLILAGADGQDPARSYGRSLGVQDNVGVLRDGGRQEHSVDIKIDPQLFIAQGAVVLRLVYECAAIS